MVAMDLFGLFVSGLFGSVLLATIALMVAFWIYGGFMRMGALLISAICVLYAIAILPTWYGSGVAVLIFLAASIYFVASLIPWMGDMWER